MVLYNSIIRNHHCFHRRNCGGVISNELKTLRSDDFLQYISFVYQPLFTPILLNSPTSHRKR